MTDDEHGQWMERASVSRVARRERLRRRRFYVRIVEWSALVAVALILAFVGVALYTDQPSFCATCHEMAPYHDAWSHGSHSKVSCVECHVAPGIFAGFAHKFVALGEVRSHFAGDIKFPRIHAADVPDSRCLRCHKTLPEKTTAGFLHSQHAARGTCAECHSDTGHDVSTAALNQVGIYSGNSSPKTIAGEVAVVGGGVANVPGHKQIDCTRCHNLAKTGCAHCHTPKHAARGACEKCHAAGATWVFAHPKSGVDCAACHKPPAKHIARTDCATCHPNSGVSWKREHVAGQDCGKCHQAPAKHHAGSCPDCHHKAGVSWSFSHPGTGANCASCHPRPAGHKPGACANCHHKPGVSWAFSHPSSSADCASCHQAPASHAGKFTGVCFKCHKRVGVSFAFVHPATHHGWHSRKCVQCHPDGYTTHRCTCHGSRQ